MYRAKGGWFMTRSQIIAVFLGAIVVAIGAGLVWRGMVPGFPPSQMVSSASAPAVAPASQKAATTSTPETKPSAPVQAQQEAATQPNTAPSQSAPALAPAQPAPDLPVFDTVRVEPSGDTVVAGHGAPEAKVALTAGDKVITEVDADGAGNFVMVPPPLAPGSYLLALRSTGKNGTTIDSQQNITVSVPPKGQTNVVVALAEPGKPSVILTDTTKSEPPVAPPPAAASIAPPAAAPVAPPAPAATAQPEVAFKTAEVDNGGFYATGTATPGADLRIYLNGTNLAEVTAGTDGHWSLTVGKGLAPGHYAVRADLIDPSGKVLARAEVPFEVPISVAEADAPVAKPAQTAASAPASPKPEPAPAASTPQMSSPPAPAPSTPAPETEAAASPNPPAAATPAAPMPASPPSKPSSNEQAAASSSLPNSSANDVVVPEIQTATVVRGDSLWRISRKVFGHGIRYTLIYEANADQIRDPSLIYPGQVFVLPHAATN
jgi:nucleoid-associated protein YgaU